MFHKNILRIVLGCLVFAMSNVGDAYSLTNTKAKVCTAFATVATGAAVGGLTLLAVQGTDWKYSSKAITAAGACVVGLGLGYLMWSSVFSKYTPMNRILAAEAAVFMAEQDTLISMPFTDVYTFVSHINVRFGTSWPLLLAREQLLAKATDLGFIFSMVHSAIRDSQGTDEAHDILQRSKVLESKLPALTKVIEQKVAVLASMPEYREQRVLYEQYMEAERQRQFEHNERSLDRWATIDSALIKARSSKPVVVINNGR